MKPSGFAAKRTGRHPPPLIQSVLLVGCCLHCLFNPHLSPILTFFSFRLSTLNLPHKTRLFLLSISIPRHSLGLPAHKQHTASERGTPRPLPQLPSQTRRTGSSNQLPRRTESLKGQRAPAFFSPAPCLSTLIWSFPLFPLFPIFTRQQPSTPSSPGLPSSIFPSFLFLLPPPSLFELPSFDYGLSATALNS